MGMRLSSIEELRNFASDETLALNGLAPGKSATSASVKAGPRQSNLELSFIELWDSLDLPTLEPEHRFHDVRRWRIDFVHLPSKTGIEIEGVVKNASRGRHQSISGIKNDAEKYFVAMSLGWTIWRLTPNLIRKPNLLLIASTLR